MNALLDCEFCHNQFQHRNETKFRGKSTVVQVLTHIKYCENNISVVKIREGAIEYLTLTWDLKDVQVVDRKGRKDFMAEVLTNARAENCECALRAGVIASSSGWQKLGKAVTAKLKELCEPCKGVFT